MVDAACHDVTVLFLGTEKYPEEGQFENFLTQHGGSSNAVSRAIRVQKQGVRQQVTAKCYM